MKARIGVSVPDRQTVRVTREHPFYVGNGTYKTLEALKVGDSIVAWDGQSLAEQRIISLERVSERVPVYNLQTDHPNTFFAGHLAVHNKGGGEGGGCFPAGTLIRTPQSETAIEKLLLGDPVVALDPEGHVVHARVESIFATQSPVLVVETDRGTLRTTDEHPIARPDGCYSPAGEVKPKDRVLVHAKGLLRSARVHGTAREESAQRVFSEQEYVTPFEEFWTFGRRLGQWKLKELLPPAHGKKVAKEENVDEESSAGQLQWYYSQTRAR